MINNSRVTILNSAAAPRYRPLFKSSNHERNAESSEKNLITLSFNRESFVDHIIFWFYYNCLLMNIDICASRDNVAEPAVPDSAKWANVKLRTWLKRLAEAYGTLLNNTIAIIVKAIKWLKQHMTRKCDSRHVIVNWFFYPNNNF